MTTSNSIFGGDEITQLEPSADESYEIRHIEIHSTLEAIDNGTLRSKLLAESAVQGALRQFPDAFSGYLLVSRDDSGHLVPVGVEAYDKLVSDRVPGWEKQELNGAPGHTVENDLAGIQPDHTQLLNLQESGKQGIYRIKIGKPFRKS